MVGKRLDRVHRGFFLHWYKSEEADNSFLVWNEDGQEENAGDVEEETRIKEHGGWCTTKEKGLWTRSKLRWEQYCQRLKSLKSAAFPKKLKMVTVFMSFSRNQEKQSGFDKVARKRVLKMQFSLKRKEGFRVHLLITCFKGDRKKNELPSIPSNSGGNWTLQTSPNGLFGSLRTVN